MDNPGKLTHTLFAYIGINRNFIYIDNI